MPPGRGLGLACLLLPAALLDTTRAFAPSGLYSRVEFSRKSVAGSGSRSSERKRTDSSHEANAHIWTGAGMVPSTRKRARTVFGRLAARGGRGGGYEDDYDYGYDSGYEESVEWGDEGGDDFDEYSKPAWNGGGKKKKKNKGGAGAGWEDEPSYGGAGGGGAQADAWGGGYGGGYGDNSPYGDSNSYEEYDDYDDDEYDDYYAPLPKDVQPKAPKKEEPVAVPAAPKREPTPMTPEMKKLVEEDRAKKAKLLAEAKAEAKRIRDEAADKEEKEFYRKLQAGELDDDSFDLGVDEFGQPQQRRKLKTVDRDFGDAEAFARLMRSRRMKQLQEERGIVDGEQGGLLNPFQGAIQAGRDLRGSIGDALLSFTGTNPLAREEGLDDAEMEEYERVMYSQFASAEEVPVVLVVGATGRTGRIIVRKLLRAGFKVRVLVRTLASTTLDLLGSGVEYAQGDLLDYITLERACSGVDKIMYCAQSSDQSKEARKAEYESFRNIIEMFQQVRYDDYGPEYVGKKMLFRFSRRRDRRLWQPAETSPYVKWNTNVYKKATFGSYNADSLLGYIAVESAPLDLNLQQFSGMLLRAIGDGLEYVVYVRTKRSQASGVQFECKIQTEENRWMTHRLPFSEFQPYRNGQMIPTSADVFLDRREVTQVGIALKRGPGDRSKFVLSMDYIWLYRTRSEPEVVYISSAYAPPIDTTKKALEAVRDLPDARGQKVYYTGISEAALRNSGLAYTIVRVKALSNAPEGIRAYRCQQNVDVSRLGPVSRADVAQVACACLLDPQATNLAFYVSQSDFSPSTRTTTRQTTNMLTRLVPNK